MNAEVQSTVKGPGRGNLALILGLAALGCLVASMVFLFWQGESLEQPALGVLGGWLGAGALGVSGWWTSRKALSGGRNDLLKYMVGGMLLRLTACGIGSGLVVGFGLLDRNGFIFGLLAGLVVFLAVEIGGLYVSAERGLQRYSPRGD